MMVSCARAQADGSEMSELQTVAGARVRKKTQRFEEEQLAATAAAAAEGSKRKRARSGSGGASSPKAAAAAKAANDRLKAEVKQLKAELSVERRARRTAEDEAERLQLKVLEQDRRLALTSSSSPHSAAAAGKLRTVGGGAAMSPPQPRQQQLMIAATRSQPQQPSLAGSHVATTLTPVDDDSPRHGSGSSSRRKVPATKHSGSRRPPALPLDDAATKTIREWWKALEGRLQGALDAGAKRLYFFRFHDESFLNLLR
jgi:hypothetical protein